jgi:hypothetical protein
MEVALLKVTECLWDLPSAPADANGEIGHHLRFGVTQLLFSFANGQCSTLPWLQTQSSAASSLAKPSSSHVAAARWCTTW